MKSHNRRQKTRKRSICPSDDFPRTSSRIGQVPVRFDLESHLIEQRKRHESMLNDDLSPTKTAALPSKKNIKGFMYDKDTDRYYPVSGIGSLKSSIAHSSNFNQVAPLRHTAIVDNNISSVSSNYINLLSRREVGSIRTTRLSLISKVLTSSIILKVQYSEISSSPNTDSYSDTDISYHPVFGVARTSPHSISTSHRFRKCDTSIDLISFTRLGASSNPHWRPSPATSYNEKAILAALVHSPTFVQTVLLRENDESSLNSNSRNVPDRRPSWIVSKVGGFGSKDQGSVRKIEWHSNCKDLFLLCETGIWMSNIERNFAPHDMSINADNSDTKMPKSTMVLSTQNADDRNYRSQAVAICNSTLGDSMKFVGYRNGELASLDLRTCSKCVAIGSLPYCIDHVECMSDDVTLIAQDITGQISLYDCRVAGRSNNIEAMRVTSGTVNEIRKVRRFWLSPDENFIVAPKKLETTLCKHPNIKSCNQPGLVAYSLRQLGDDINGCRIGGQASNNILSNIDLTLPSNRLVAESDILHSELSVLSSTVKMASSSSGNMDYNSLYGAGDLFCNGLYCVAGVEEIFRDSQSAVISAKSAGSALFKASCI